MKLPILSTLGVVLTVTSRADAFIIFCFLAQLFWNPNACGWRPINIGGGGGGGGIKPPPPPPPVVCGPGTYLWKNTCLTTIGECNKEPETQIFAHPEKPCGCQAPSALYDPKKTVCNAPPPQGKMYCETAKDGRSSSCKVQCDPGWKYNPKTSRCIQDNLEGCPAPKDLSSGPPNKGCICLEPGDPVVSLKGEKCGEVPYYDPDDEAAGRDPPGRMVCIIPPGDISNSRCEAQCIAGYKVQGTKICVPAGV